MSGKSAPRFLEGKEIDPVRWNHCIRRSAAATVFAEHDFLSIACPRWHALVQGDYEAVMPLPSREKWGIRYICSPPFFPRLGIFSAGKIAPETTRAFFNRIPLRFLQVDLLLNPQTEVPADSWHVTRMRSYRLDPDLSRGEREKRFSQNTKRNIAAARKAGLSYVEDVEVQDIITLFQQGRGKEKYVPYTAADYTLLSRLARHAAYRGLLDRVGTRDGNGTLLAGALFLRDATTRWFWFSGRDLRFPEKKAMFFLLSEYLQRQDDESSLDFNGSMNDNIARFYKGFGGEPYEFPAVSLTPCPLFSPFINVYHKIRKL